MRGTRACLTLLGLFLPLTAACGAPAGPPTPHLVQLGLNDAGKTVHVRVGDTVEVRLEDQFPVPGSSLVWRVSSSPAGVLDPDRDFTITVVVSG